MSRTLWRKERLRCNRLQADTDRRGRGLCGEIFFITTGLARCLSRETNVLGYRPNRSSALVTATAFNSEAMPNNRARLVGVLT